MARINKEEYQLLKELENRDFKWLAKDRDKTLIASQSRPSKTDEMWGDERTRFCFNYKDSQLFQFIQWEDEEPHNIQELIEEYEVGKIILAMAEEGIALEFECESEETEVKKDMDWLNNELEKVIKAVESDDIYFAGKDDYDEGYIDGIRDVQPIINQLETEVPEVLSDKWIDDNSVYASSDGITEEYVHVDDLENLLVPKQEITEEQAKDALEEKGYTIARMYDSDNETVLPYVFYRQVLLAHGYLIIEKPVIPKFVADWIEENRSKYGKDILEIGYDFYETDLDNLEVDDWVGINTETFARAWLDGYEVEEEPIYIIDTDDIEISDGNHYLTNLTLSKDSVKLPIVGDKFDAIRFDDINQAEAIASYVCGRVEELEE